MARLWVLAAAALLALGCAANPTISRDAGRDAGGAPDDAGSGADAGRDSGASGGCGDGVVTAPEACDPGLDPCCDATCTGPASAGAECRPSAGACDLAEVCDGVSTSCPADAVASASTECRPSAGPCDVPESCDGASAECPADAFAPTSTECRPSAGACDVPESCDGASAACPANAFAPSTTECRPSVGPCDVAESCSGVAATCPADAFASSATVCRASIGGCDPVERCTGASVTCPADVSAGPPNIGLFAADDAAAHTTVQGFLVGTGLLGSVTVGGPVTTSYTPTLAELSAFDAIFVWGSAAWDGTAFGNVLADYVDAGGGVVIAVFAQRAGASVGVSGRMESAGYLPYVPSSYMFEALTLGSVAMPAHPIMSGVSTFSGDNIAYHDGPIAAGGTLIASLSNGRPLAATLEPSAGRTALLGFYPVRFWHTTSDGAVLMANTLAWAAGCN